MFRNLYCTYCVILVFINYPVGVGHGGGSFATSFFFVRIVFFVFLNYPCREGGVHNLSLGYHVMTNAS